MVSFAAHASDWASFIPRGASSRIDSRRRCHKLGTSASLAVLKLGFMVFLASADMYSLRSARSKLCTFHFGMQDSSDFRFLVPSFFPGRHFSLQIVCGYPTPDRFWSCSSWVRRANQTALLQTSSR